MVVVQVSTTAMAMRRGAATLPHRGNTQRRTGEDSLRGSNRPGGSHCRQARSKKNTRAHAHAHTHTLTPTRSLTHSLTQLTHSLARSLPRSLTWLGIWCISVTPLMRHCSVPTGGPSPPSCLCSCARARDTRKRDGRRKSRTRRREPTQRDGRRRRGRKSGGKRRKADEEKANVQ